MSYATETERDRRLRQVQQARSVEQWSQIRMIRGRVGLESVAHPNRLLVMARASKGRYA